MTAGSHTTLCAAILVAFASIPQVVVTDAAGVSLYVALFRPY
jgi:hypothetical protein